MTFLSKEVKFLCDYLSFNKNKDYDHPEKILTPEESAEILKTAEDQGLFTLGGKNLLDYIEKRSPGFEKAYYEKKLKAYESRSFNLSVRLLKILKTLQSENIIAVPVKGPLLAEYLYGDISKRSFADLDIFIYQKDLYKAVQILEESGYKPELNLDEKKMEKFSNQEYVFKLYDQATHTIIEIHWELSGRYTKKPVKLEDYIEKSFYAEILNKKVLKLPDEEEFIYLCIHSAKHCYEKLEMIYSIAVFYEKIKNSYDFIMQKADEMKCRKIVLFSLYLCKKFLNLELNAKALSQISSCEDFEKLINQDLYFYEDNTSLIETRFSNFHIKLQESIYLKIILRLRLIFNPTYKDWGFFRLPSKLSFLYYFFRPLRLAFQYFTKG